MVVWQWAVWSVLDALLEAGMTTDELLRLLDAVAGASPVVVLIIITVRAVCYPRGLKVAADLAAKFPDVTSR